MMERETLDSWKEIASFLRRGVRTVQRWERTEGLPVRRHHHLKRGSVYALRSDLANWQQTRNLRTAVIRSRPQMQEFERLRNLTAHQVTLAGELKLLFKRNAEQWAQQRQAKSLRIAAASVSGKRA